MPRPGDGRATLTWVAKEDFCEGGRSALSPESQKAARREQVWGRAFREEVTASAEAEAGPNQASSGAKDVPGGLRSEETGLGRRPLDQAACRRLGKATWLSGGRGSWTQGTTDGSETSAYLHLQGIRGGFCERIQGGHPRHRVGEGGPAVRLQPQEQQAMQRRVSPALGAHVPEADAAVPLGACHKHGHREWVGRRWSTCFGWEGDAPGSCSFSTHPAPFDPVSQGWEWDPHPSHLRSLLALRPSTSQLSPQNCDCLSDVFLSLA